MITPARCESRALYWSKKRSGGQEVNDTVHMLYDFSFISRLQCLGKVYWLSMGVYVCCNQCRATKTSFSLNVYHSTSGPFFFYAPMNNEAGGE